MPRLVRNLGAHTTDCPAATHFHQSRPKAFSSLSSTPHPYPSSFAASFCQLNSCQHLQQWPRKEHHSTSRSCPTTASSSKSSVKLLCSRVLSAGCWIRTVCPPTIDLLACLITTDTFSLQMHSRKARTTLASLTTSTVSSWKKSASTFTTTRR